MKLTKLTPPPIPDRLPGIPEDGLEGRGGQSQERQNVGPPLRLPRSPAQPRQLARPSPTSASSAGTSASPAGTSASPAGTSTSASGAAASAKEASANLTTHCVFYFSLCVVSCK